MRQVFHASVAESRAISCRWLSTGACSSTAPAARDGVERRLAELATTDEVQEEVDGVVSIYKNIDDAEE